MHLPRDSTVLYKNSRLAIARGYSAQECIETKVDFEMDLKVLAWLLVSIVSSVLCYSPESDDIGRTNVSPRRHAKTDNRHTFHFHVEHPQLREKQTYPLSSRTEDMRKKGVVESEKEDNESILLEEAKYDSMKRLDNMPRSLHQWEVRPRHPKMKIPDSHVTIYGDVPRASNKKKSKKDILDSSLLKQRNEDSGHHIFFHMGPLDYETEQRGNLSPQPEPQPQPEHSWQSKPRVESRSNFPKSPRRSRPTQRSQHFTETEEAEADEKWRNQKELVKPGRKPLKYLAAVDSDKKDLHVASVNSHPVIQNLNPEDGISDDQQEEINPPRYQNRLTSQQKKVVDRRALSWNNEEPPFDSTSDNNALVDDVSFEEPKTLTVEDMNFGRNNREQFHEQGRRGQSSYKFGYNTGDRDNPMARYEERDADGVVRGSYSFVDANGKMQVVHYESHPEHGFRTKGSLGYHAGGF